MSAAVRFGEHGRVVVDGGAQPGRVLVGDCSGVGRLELPGRLGVQVGRGFRPGEQGFSGREVFGCEPEPAGVPGVRGRVME